MVLMNMTSIKFGGNQMKDWKTAKKLFDHYFMAAKGEKNWFDTKTMKICTCVCVCVCIFNRYNKARHTIAWDEFTWFVFFIQLILRVYICQTMDICPVNWNGLWYTIRQQFVPFNIYALLSSSSSSMPCRSFILCNHFVVCFCFCSLVCFRYQYFHYYYYAYTYVLCDLLELAMVVCISVSHCHLSSTIVGACFVIYFQCIFSTPLKTNKYYFVPCTCSTHTLLLI